MNWADFIILLDNAVASGVSQLQQASENKMEQSRVIEKHNERSATRQIDITVQKTVLSILNSPLIEVISEDAQEAPKVLGEFFVVLDPIDGTTNFNHGLPFYAISIAAGRFQEKAPRVCDIEIAIIATMSNDRFTAWKDKGARMNESSIKTSQVTELAEAIIRPSSEFTKKDPILDRKVGSHLYLGSTAIELALLARGSIDVFIETKRRKVFDFAAAYLIAKEAGAIISDLQGNSIDNEYITKDMRSTLIIAANEKIHKEAALIYK